MTIASFSVKNSKGFERDQLDIQKFEQKSIQIFSIFSFEEGLQEIKGLQYSMPTRIGIRFENHPFW